MSVDAVQLFVTSPEGVRDDVPLMVPLLSSPLSIRTTNGRSVDHPFDEAFMRVSREALCETKSHVVSAMLTVVSWMFSDAVHRGELECEGAFGRLSKDSVESECVRSLIVAMEMAHVYAMRYPPSGVTPVDREWYSPLRPCGSRLTATVKSDMKQYVRRVGMSGLTLDDVDVRMVSPDPLLRLKLSAVQALGDSTSRFSFPKDYLVWPDHVVRREFLRRALPVVSSLEEGVPLCTGTLVLAVRRETRRRSNCLTRSVSMDFNVIGPVCLDEDVDSADVVGGGLRSTPSRGVYLWMVFY